MNLETEQLRVMSRISKVFSGADWNELAEAFLRTLPDGVVVCDALGKIVLANAAAKRLAQLDPEGKPISLAPSLWGDMFDLNDQPVPAADWPCVKSLLRGESTHGSEFRLLWCDGRSYDVVFSASPIKNDSGCVSGSIATLTDVSGIKHRFSKLREEGVLGERARIAAEIHDTVAQGFTAIVLHLQSARNQFVANSADTLQYLQSVQEVAQNSLNETRRMMWALSNEPGESEDPAVGLAFLAKKLFENTPIQLELSLEQQARLSSSELRHELFWLGKEALINVLKHSGATRVQLELSYQGSEVRLCVQDDGKGFVPSGSLSERRGFGLYSLKTRAARVGGHVVIQSRPGQGTTVVARLPLTRQANRVLAVAEAQLDPATPEVLTQRLSAADHDPTRR
jgi:signal transduction histidine kinase